MVQNLLVRPLIELLRAPQFHMSMDRLFRGGIQTKFMLRFCAKILILEFAYHISMFSEATPSHFTSFCLASIFHGFPWVCNILFLFSFSSVEFEYLKKKNTYKTLGGQASVPSVERGGTRNWFHLLWQMKIYEIRFH